MATLTVGEYYWITYYGDLLIAQYTEDGWCNGNDALLTQDRVNVISHIQKPTYF